MTTAIFLNDDTSPRIVSIPIRGMPVPKGRPRFGRGGVYTPPRTKEYEALVRAKVLDAKRAAGMGDLDCFEGPVAVRIVIVRGEHPYAIVAVSHLAPKMTGKRTPDLDNMAKSILDGLMSYKSGGVLIPGLIADDSQVVRLLVEFE